MVIIAWIIVVVFVFLVFMFRKKNAANLKVKSKDGTMVQISERRRKVLRFVWYFSFGLSVLIAIALSSQGSSSTASVPVEQKVSQAAPTETKDDSQSIKPYPYQIVSVDKSDFAGRRRSAVRVVIYEAGLDGYNTDRLKETARDAATKCGRVSQAYLVWLYDRDVDATEGGTVTVGMMYVGKWTGSEAEEEKATFNTTEERESLKEMNDKIRAEKKSS